MKKREFLAMTGAVPLMMAGCGGDGSGNAPVRLVNASVGYQTGLGFSVQNTQAVSGITYGNASAFESVQAGTVTTSVTVNTGTGDSPLSTSTRTLSKDSRYSLIAYGFLNELRSVLLTETTDVPDSNTAYINVFNTSADIGAVDVYLSTGSAPPGNDLSLATLIASSVNGVAQSSFVKDLALGSYYVTVVGAGTVAQGILDQRFQSTTPIAITNQQVVTLILTPGASGTLANMIALVQGTSGTTTSQTNTTARVRAISAVPAGTTVAVSGVFTTNRPNSSQYVVTTTGAPPAIMVGGQTVVVSGSTTTLSAGGDYTIMVYDDATTGVATAVMLTDDNTAPTSTSGAKFRLINLATTDALSMTINGQPAGTNVGYASASNYVETTVPANVSSTVTLLEGAEQLTTFSQPLTIGKIYTEIVYSVNPVVQTFAANSVAT